MRIVLQRVNWAKVSVDQQVAGEIDRGILILVGIQSGDDKKTIQDMLDKVIHLRIFEDENGKMNLSLQEIGGELLVVPNFTIYGDARKGRRPGYSAGASPEEARGIFAQMEEMAKVLPIKKVQFGIFRADMKVELCNDGPVTLLLDSDKLF
ncbi:MAG: D-tyrosyl-tRNA(Tyr) deacylase [Clostridiales bacterium]|nr:D-tyrosyl-tRNA(Tyr) deacylase [Clostridiales bacterium]